jgi:hypothetical protein
MLSAGHFISILVNAARFERRPRSPRSDPQFEATASLGFVRPAPMRFAGVFRQPRTLVSLPPIPQGVVHPRILPWSAPGGLCKIAQQGRQIPTETSRLSLQIWPWIRYDRPSSQTEAPVKMHGKVSFDPKAFLARVGEGKTIATYRKDQIVFSQGEIADAVFYIQKGKIKLSVVSE